MISLSTIESAIRLLLSCLNTIKDILHCEIDFNNKNKSTTSPKTNRDLDYDYEQNISN